MIDPEEGDELLREIIRDKRRELNRDAGMAALEVLRLNTSPERVNETGLSFTCPAAASADG